MLVCGTSGSGKSTLTTGDPRAAVRARATSSRSSIPRATTRRSNRAVVLGAPKRAPLVDEVLDVLARPDAQRRRQPARRRRSSIGPSSSRSCCPRSPSCARAPAGRTGSSSTRRTTCCRRSGNRPPSVPARAARHALRHRASRAASRQPVVETIDTVLVVGEHPEQTVAEFCKVASSSGAARRSSRSRSCRPARRCTGETGEPVATLIETEQAQERAQAALAQVRRGQPRPDRAFYFRGPDGKLNLKAHNLHAVRAARRWRRRRHLAVPPRQRRRTRTGCVRRSRIRRSPTRSPRSQSDSDAAPGRRAAPRIRTAIEKRYTLPADKPSGLVDKSDVSP